MVAAETRAEAAVERLDVHACTIPTDEPEADGTREWDSTTILLGVPLVTLLGAAHEGVPIYGSGGFCSYSNERLQEQLGDWAAAGIPRVKMKVGREPERDPGRLDAAREAIGDDVELFVDANGA